MVHSKHDLSTLLAQSDSSLRLSRTESEVFHICDDEKNLEISTIPVLGREERYLKLDACESYIYISLQTPDKQTETIKIASADLFNPKVYLKSFGTKPFARFASSDEWELFFRVIRILTVHIEQQEIYMYSGWTGDYSQYIIGGLKITATDCCSIKSTLTKNDTLISTDAPGHVFQDVTDIIQGISSDEFIGYAMLMYNLLSIIKQSVIYSDNIAPSFSLAIIGPTGSYKTSVAKEMFNPLRITMCNFEDSEASIRRELLSIKSGAAVIDDYKCSSKSNDGKFEKILRLSGDITTNGKIVSGNKVVDETFTGMSVITGEVYPHLQHSSYARVLFIDLAENPVDKDYLTLFQEVNPEYLKFIIMFVQYVLANDRFNADLVNKFKTSRDKISSDDKYKNMHGRYCDMYAWFCSIWDIYVDFAEKYGVHVTYDFPKTMAEHIYRQSSRYDNDPVKLFQIGFNMLLESNQLTVVPWPVEAEDGFDVIDLGTNLYIKSGCVFKKIVKYWASVAIDFPCTERKLRERLCDKGLLCMHDGRRTYERKLRGKISISGYDLYKNLIINEEDD